MKYTFTYRTISRYPKLNYLNKSISSLLKVCDFTNNGLLVICSNDNTGYIDDYSHILNYKLIIPNYIANPNETALLAIREATKIDTEYIVFCEDDIIFSHLLVSKMDEFIKITDFKNNTDIPIGVLYTAPYHGHMSAFSENKDNWKYPVIDFYGTQCFIMTKQTAIKFADTMELYLHDIKSFPWELVPYHEFLSFRMFDFWIKEIFKYLNPELQYFYSIVPSLCQHIGVESVMDCDFHSTNCFLE